MTENSIHVVCGNCNAINRMPFSKLKEKGNCGQCKTPFFQGKPFKLTKNSFQKNIQKNDLPVVIDCWAPWCQPCLQVAPIFQKATETLEPFVRFAKLNTQEEPELGSQLGILHIPTFLLYHKGNEIARQSGGMDLMSLLGWIRSNTAS